MCVNNSYCNNLRKRLSLLMVSFPQARIRVNISYICMNPSVELALRANLELRFLALRANSTKKPIKYACFSSEGRVPCYVSA